MKRRGWILIVFIVILSALIYLSYRNQLGVFQKEDYYSRGQAAKMLTLLMEKADDVEEAEVTTAFSDVKETKWYAKYVSEAVRLNLMKGEGDEFSPEDGFTYQDASYLLDTCNLDKSQYGYSFDSKKTMSEKEFLVIYEDLLEGLKGQTLVEKKEVYVYEWNEEETQLATNEGSFLITGFQGEDFVHKCICLYVQGQIGVAYAGNSSASVTLANTWCLSSNHSTITVFSDGYECQFRGDLSEGITYEKQIIDITVSNNGVDSITKKETAAAGEVLAVTEQNIEIAGKGTMPLDEKVKIYQTYGSVKMVENRGILIGYEKASFVIEDNKVSAIVIPEAFASSTLRVLLNTSNYGSVIHEKVIITSDTDFIVTYGEKEKQYSAGKKLTIKPDNKYLKTGRIIISPKEEGTLTVLSLKRAYGNPAYRGSLEVAACQGGLTLINEVDLEQYLYAVVPSEMPVSYGEEALKVQAVCARSFAYNQLYSSNYAEYGAHLDDSVQSQVYNNSKETPESIAAVEATRGQVIKYKDNIVSTYFFSTSCGYTGNSTDVWISKSKAPAYLSGRLQAKEETVLQLNTEEAFEKFIKQPEDYDFFEKDCPWFRWNVTMDAKEVKEAIDAHLSSVISAVKVKDKKGKFVSKKITTIGEVKDMQVIKRSDSGVMMSLLITGSKATIQVSGEYAIRALLGNYDVAITTKDGSRNNMTMLPSGYFYIEKVTNKEGNVIQYSYDGGGYGHGVGMSQNGVKAMAEQGYSWEEILAHYFKDTKLETIVTKN